MNPQQPGQPVSYNSSPHSGAKSTILIAVLALLLVAALVFGLHSYSQMQDYKNNTDKKIAAAVEVSKKTSAQELQDNFDKANTKSFQGSATYGSISFNYPKTWSAYVDNTSQNEPINGYFMPDVVPGISGQTAFALRTELLSTDYSQVMQQFQSQVQQGTVTAKAYLPPKLSGAANVQPGTLLSGQIVSSDSTKHGTMLVIKVRDKTLEVSTQSQDYLNDFNNIILPTLTFAP